MLEWQQITKFQSGNSVSHRMAISKPALMSAATSF